VPDTALYQALFLLLTEDFFVMFTQSVKIRLKLKGQ